METVGQTVATANRLHIGFFGPRNSGKSSLLNALTGQSVAIVSEVAGTTTDAVSKPIELRGIGPCVLLDTAGFDEAPDDPLGRSRVAASRRAAGRCDLALLVLDGRRLWANGGLFAASEAASGAKPARVRPELDTTRDWLAFFDRQETPYLLLLNQTEGLDAEDKRLLCQKTAEYLQVDVGNVLALSALDGSGMDALRLTMKQRLEGTEDGRRRVTGGLAHQGDTVLLLIPQDIQAPKGRLIPAQVETIRELLDIGCRVLSVTLPQYRGALDALRRPPELIITDSQVFREAYAGKPAGSLLTSFSVLYAAYKGDLRTYLAGAEAMAGLKPDARILIAEACTHQPTNEDIGRVKLPRLLRRRFGDALRIEVAGGQDFPDTLTAYDLIIQCGGCMFNRKNIMSRLRQARAQGVPICNYGICLAALNDILPLIALPEA